MNLWRNALKLVEVELHYNALLSNTKNLLVTSGMNRLLNRNSKKCSPPTLNVGKLACLHDLVRFYVATLLSPEFLSYILSKNTAVHWGTSNNGLTGIMEFWSLIWRLKSHYITKSPKH